MLDTPYGGAARLQALAAARKTRTGEALVAAAEAHKKALIAFLTEWEHEYDAGQSMQTPSRFAGIAAHWLDSHETAERARDLNQQRNLSYVLATAPLREVA